MVRKGELWERPASGPAELEVTGDDADLATAVRDRPGVRVAFRPSPRSDVARAVGVHGPGDAALELALDALAVVVDDRRLFAVNMLVVGAAPDRTTWRTGAVVVRVTVDGRVVHDGPATGVVVATGQHLRGLDLVPRGHPGDGRAEVQVHAVPRRQRAAVRERLPQGVHLPHPGITQAGGRHVEVAVEGVVAALELDGEPAGTADAVVVDVVGEAYRLLV